MSTAETPPIRKYFGLAEAARELFPPSRGGRPLHPNTVVRFANPGAQARDGSRIRLQLTRLPGRWVVTREAVESFLAAVTRDRLGEPETPPSPNAATRR